MARVQLFFGPDQGLVRERAKAAVTAVTGDPKDPFRVVELAASSLKDDPARLSDEAAQISFTGGKRVVWLREASDSLAPILKSFLADPAGDAAIVIEAGDLGKSGALRKLAESSPLVTATGCYHDSSRDMVQVISETLRGHGLTASPDAVHYLAEHLGGDRLVSRAELDKLALYVHPARHVELADAQATVGDSAAVSMEDVVQATSDGDLAGLDRALARAFLDGESPVGLVRAALRHFHRLHQAAIQVSKGRSPVQAIAGLRPPPFKRDADRLARQLQRWDVAATTQALARLSEAEILTKSTGIPDRPALARSLTVIATLPKRLARAR